MTSCIYLLMQCAFRFKIYNIFVYFFKLTSTTATQVTTFVAGSLEAAYSLNLGCPEDLGKGWRGDLGTFMISRPS